MRISASCNRTLITSICVRLDLKFDTKINLLIVEDNSVALPNIRIRVSHSEQSGVFALWEAVKQGGSEVKVASIPCQRYRE